MIKPLEDALGKVLRLPKEKQEVAAELLEQLAQSEGEPYPLSPDERSAVRDALARAQRGEFADEAAVDTLLRRPWDLTIRFDPKALSDLEEIRDYLIERSPSGAACL